MNQETQGKIKANLFAASHDAIEDWQDFPWHRDRDGAYTAGMQQSSQAIAIDVFGTLKKLPSLDAAMAAIAQELDAPDEGPWSIKLEWEDDQNLLKEPRPTQVDAIAFGAKAVVFFEIKFTEKDGGSCSQTEPIRKGPHKGIRQCNGQYEMQTNPVNNKTARCALTGKDIRYWELIPSIFNFAADADHKPCPFAGGWYQWMRNLVLAKKIASNRGVTPVFAVAYADAPGLPMAEKIGSDAWNTLTTKLKPEAQIRTISLQRVVDLASEADGLDGEDATVLRDLSGWIRDKIDAASLGAEASHGGPGN